MTYRATYKTRNNNFTVTYDLPDNHADLVYLAAYHNLRKAGLKTFQHQRVMVTACQQK